MYKFRFSAWDKNTNAGRYDSTSNETSVTVVADNEADALEEVKRLVQREVYELASVSHVFK